MKCSQTTSNPTSPRCTNCQTGTCQGERSRPEGSVSGLKFPTIAPPTEWSIPFLQGMLDRMAVSFFKYGAVADSPGIDEVRGLLLRLIMYLGVKRSRAIFSDMEALYEAAEKRGQKPGNTEWLMDVGNFAMIEFMRPSVRGAHFKATESKSSPGLVFAPDEFDGTVEISQRAHDGTPAI